MSNGKIYYNNLNSQEAIPEDTPAAAGFGARFVANNNRGVVWRSVDSTEHIIPFFFQDVCNIKAVVLLNHNIVAGDTCVFEASASPDFSVINATIDVPPDTGVVELHEGFDDFWSYRNFRLRISKALPAAYIQVGEVFLAGEIYQFQRNYKWSYTFTKEINRNSRQTTSGQVYRKTRFIRRGFDIQFEGMDDAQKETFESVSESDYICFQPQGDQGGLYYGVIDFSSYTHVYNDFWSVSCNFMENPE